MYSLLFPGDRLGVDVISDPPEDLLFGQTLRRPFSTDQISEIQKYGRQSLEDEKFQEFVIKDILDQSNFLFFFETLSLV